MVAVSAAGLLEPTDQKNAHPNSLACRRRTRPSLDERAGVRRQSIADQINRRPEDVMEIVTISSGEAKNKPRAVADSVDHE